ncbi:MAG: sarcosine oxidase subunit delta [Rhodospirillaceae bacterium TMED8]|nr:sarcosine oxidase subunit delta [Magnetovibrio sp.]OUT50763.1 MAG: sarcosine oxidase subunit delta [Rhodospirillaceae bacterium TMED8]
MFLINCPYCGPREESEFHPAGEAHLKRPANPEKLSDIEWADYLFMRQNTKGILLERWVHRHGCRRWFNVARDTRTNKVLHVYQMGDSPPTQLKHIKP